VLGLWLAGLLLCVGVILRTPFAADMSAFLPASPNPAQQLLVEQIRSGLPARTVLLGIDGGTAATRAQASRALAAALRADPLFDPVQNGERGSWEAGGQWLLDHRYQLSPSVTPERFTVDGLRAAFDDTLSLLGTPAGALVKPLLGRDPTGETRAIAEALLPSSTPRLDDGVWAGRSDGRAVLMLSTRAPGSDLDAQALALDRIRTTFDTLAVPGLQLQLSGGPVFAVASRAQIEKEVRFLAGAGALAMGTLLWLAFASWSALLVAALPVAAGVLAGITAVSLVFGGVHGMTLGFGSTLIGEAVDYAIYFLIQSRAGVLPGDVPGQGWRRWLRSGWPTVRIGLLTSLCGFAALTFSGFPGLAQLGVFSMAGLTAGALTARFVLPRLMPDGASGHGLRRQLGRWCGHLLRVLPRWRLPVLVLGVAALLSLGLSSQPLWRADLSALSPASPAAVALDEQLRTDLSTSDSGTLVLVQGAALEQALVRAEAVATRLEALRDAGKISGFDSPTRLMPSLARQAQRQASLPDAPTLRQLVAQATQGGALTPALLKDFERDVALARQARPLSREDVLATPLAPLLDGLLLSGDDGHWTVLMPLQAPLVDSGAASIDVAALRAALDPMAGVQVLEFKHELDALYAGYLSDALWQGSLGALAVLVLLLLWLRDLRRLWRVCVPLAMTVLLVLAAWQALGVALGVLHLVGLLLVVAVGSNYALFFDSPADAEQPGPPSEDLLASLLLANLTTVVSFGLIAQSGIPALSAIGRMVAPGVLLAFVLCAVFVHPASGGGAVRKSDDH
jgi:predicted exporter